MATEKRVLLCAWAFRNAGPEPRRLLQEGGATLAEVHLDRALRVDELIEALPGVVGTIAGNERYTEEVFVASPELRVVSRWGIGVDTVDLGAATRHGVVVTNTPRLTANGVADYTFALMLACARRVVEADRVVRENQWRELRGFDVWQQCLGIVGFGTIGQAVARRARGFEMRILAYDPAPNEAAAQELGVELVSLEYLLQQADFVTLHATVTDSSRGMMDAHALSLMKPTAFLLNMGRGALVDEAALVAALQSGALAGAALDVHSAEPPGPDYPLAKLDNCLLSPHTASMSRGTIAAVSRRAALNLLEVLDGGRPEFVVNPEVYEVGLRPGV